MAAGQSERSVADLFHVWPSAVYRVVEHWKKTTPLIHRLAMAGRRLSRDERSVISFVWSKKTEESLKKPSLTYSTVGSPS